MKKNKLHIPRPSENRKQKKKKKKEEHIPKDSRRNWIIK